MATYSVWILEESNISVSGGKTLDGITQGDGSHLVGETITLNARAWKEVRIKDKGKDHSFDDNDGDQELDGAQTIDGVTYPKGTGVEAEYRIVLQDSNGNQYEAIGFNVNNSSPSYGTIEGLAFVGPPRGWPPVGQPLTVVSASEGPGSSGQAPLPVEDLVVPCFTPGTMIDTPRGPVPVEELRVGDEVDTLEHGAQRIRWLGRVTLGPEALAARPELRPILLRRGALGPGLPRRDMMLSPQHRVLVGGWRAEIFFGESECLIAVGHMVNGDTILRTPGGEGVTYIHFLLDRHEIVRADGLLAESFLPGPMTLAGLPEQSRAELLALFPELARERGPALTAARPLINRWEAGLLTGAGGSLCGQGGIGAGGGT